MTHSYTLPFRILPSRPALFLTMHTRFHSRIPSSPRNEKSRNITSTPKYCHTDTSENSTMRDLSNVDVLIVGAGPAGLMMASSLVRSGVSFRIIERRYAYDKPTLLTPRIPFSFSDLTYKIGQPGNRQVTVMAFSQGQWKFSRCVWSRLFLSHFLTCSFFYSTSDSYFFWFNSMSRQTYGLLSRLLEEGNHIHMAVRLSVHYACAISAQTFSKSLFPVYPISERG